MYIKSEKLFSSRLVIKPNVDNRFKKSTKRIKTGPLITHTENEKKISIREMIWLCSNFISKSLLCKRRDKRRKKEKRIKGDACTTLHAVNTLVKIFCATGIFLIGLSESVKFNITPFVCLTVIAWFLRDINAAIVYLFYWPLLRERERERERCHDNSSGLKTNALLSTG
uniref:Uncharacterized protein n=1 Tax=Glossina pallidipes TaxID=7398 RepID=A0A1A9ZIW3_GLOPL